MAQKIEKPATLAGKAKAVSKSTSTTKKTTEAKPTTPPVTTKPTTTKKPVVAKTPTPTPVTKPVVATKAKSTTPPVEPKKKETPTPTKQLTATKTKAKTPKVSSYPKTEKFYEEIPDGYKPIVQVKKAKEIRGRVVALEFSTETNKGSMTIEDLNGTGHAIEIRKSIHFDSVMYYMGKQINYPNYKKMDADDQGKSISAALKLPLKAPLLFRIAEDKSGEYLFGIMSNKWRQVAADDYVDIVKDKISALKIKADVDFTPHDGLHGGYITLSPEETHDTLKQTAVFNFGLWNGRNGISINSKTVILACSNMLTTDIRGKMKNLKLGSASRLYDIHAGEDVKFETLVEKVVDSMADYFNIVDIAKKTKLDDKQIETILNYYLVKHIISVKSLAVIQEKLKDKKIQQVPNTMYGLAMVVSYVGTHTEGIKAGVQLGISRVAGEIIVVSQDFDAYYKIVSSVESEEPEKEEADEEAVKKEVPVPIPVPTAKPKTKTPTKSKK